MNQTRPIKRLVEKSTLLGAMHNLDGSQSPNDYYANLKANAVTVGIMIRDTQRTRESIQHQRLSLSEQLKTGLPDGLCADAAIRRDFITVPVVRATTRTVAENNNDANRTCHMCNGKVEQWTKTYDGFNSFRCELCGKATCRECAFAWHGGTCKSKTCREYPPDQWAYMLNLKDEKAAAKQLLAVPFGFHYDNVKWVEQNGWIVPRNHQTSNNASNEANVLNQSAEARR